MDQIQRALEKARQRYGDPVRALLVETTLSEARSIDGSARPAADASQWSALPAADIRTAHLARNRIVTADRSDPAHWAFDRLRTKLLREMRSRNFTSVAITSPTAGCGKSVIASNLAFSFGHLEECRSLAIDLDLGQTRMADLLGLDQAAAMEDFLAGRRSVRRSFVRHGFNLAFGANGHRVAYAAELLHSASTIRALAEAYGELQPDIVIYDLPPMLAGDHVIGFLPHVDCVVLVAAAEASTLAEIDLCERELAEKSNLLGVVLNKCRYP
jgi:Mrp family chromosome partitioning ATPase